jgi:hypothetical protein
MLVWHIVGIGTRDRERLLSEAGVGWVRLYPTGVGSFESIVQNVRAVVLCCICRSFAF